MNTKEFFEALYPKFDNNNNQIELRPINVYTELPEKIRRFKDLDSLIKYSDSIDSENKYHVFFELAELKPTARNGQEDSIVRLNFLFSDLDPHIKDSKGNILRSFTKAELMARLDSFPIRPSIILDSGFGYHAYWLLDIPLYDHSIAKVILGRIQEMLEGDSKAILLTQLFRVPYTKNLKQVITGGQPVEAKIVESNCKRYSIKGIMSALGISEEDIVSSHNVLFKEGKKKLKEANSKEVIIFDGIQFNFSKKPKPLGIKVDNFADLLTLLKKQDIRAVSNMPQIPLRKNFKCCFHDDSKPSANIFTRKDGAFVYHCFGCGTTYDIITIYQKVTKSDFSRALVDLAEFYGIEYEYSEWIRGQIDKYYRNSTIQLNFEKYGYDSMYPNAYKLIQPRIKYLHLLNHYGLGNLKTEKFSYDGQGLFFVSYEYFADHFGKGYSVTLDTAKRCINLFCVLGIIRKVSIQELPQDISTVAMECIQNTIDRVNRTKGIKIKTAEPVNFYVIYETHDRLKLAEERAKKLIANGFKIGKTMNKEFLILALGQEIANEVYPDQRTISKVNASIASRLETTLKELISQQGYATKDQIIAKTKLSGRLHAGRDKKERELEKFLNQILSNHNLEYVRANKTLMETLGLKKSVFIIIPKGMK